MPWVRNGGRERSRDDHKGEALGGSLWGWDSSIYWPGWWLQESVHVIKWPTWYQCQFLLLTLYYNHVRCNCWRKLVGGSKGLLGPLSLQLPVTVTISKCKVYSHTYLPTHMCAHACMIHTVTWMNLEYIMLSEGREAHRLYSG